MAQLLSKLRNVGSEAQPLFLLKFCFSEVTSDSVNRKCYWTSWRRSLMVPWSGWLLQTDQFHFATCQWNSTSFHDNLPPSPTSTSLAILQQIHPDAQRTFLSHLSHIQHHSPLSATIFLVLKPACSSSFTISIHFCIPFASVRWNVSDLWLRRALQGTLTSMLSVSLEWGFEFC